MYYAVIVQYLEGLMLRNITKNNNNKGFTLVEIGLVVAIGGMLMVMALSAYKVYNKKQVLVQSNERIDKLNSAMIMFYAENKRYPCPALLTLPEASPLVGIEDCAGATLTAGARDANLDLNLTNDNVLIGAIPFATLNIPIFANDGDGDPTNDIVMSPFSIRDTYDAWFNKMTYAVTESMTVEATFEEEYGAVGVNIENGGGSLLIPPDSAHYVLISHGKDGKGAYTPDGVLKTPCAGLDLNNIENCDNDAIFINGLKNMAITNAYFDDIMRFSSWKVTSLWRQVGDTDDIYNVNPGNVGIGTDTPLERLHVDGNVRATNAYADVFCDPTATDCMDPAAIGGDGSIITCPNANETMIGIANNSANCETLTGIIVVDDTCSNPNTLANGFNADGTLICVSY